MTSSMERFSISAADLGVLVSFGRLLGSALTRSALGDSDLLESSGGVEAQLARSNARKNVMAFLVLHPGFIPCSSHFVFKETACRSYMGQANTIITLYRFRSIRGR
jgi:hypothetical protein